MVVVRHGLMLVGQPISGKSAALKVLAESLTQLKDDGHEGVLFNRVQVSASGGVGSAFITLVAQRHWWFLSYHAS